MTDRRTDGRTDRQTELRWLRRAIAVSAVARKNLCRFYFFHFFEEIIAYLSVFCVFVFTVCGLMKSSRPAMDSSLYSSGLGHGLRRRGLGLHPLTQVKGLIDERG